MEYGVFDQKAFKTTKITKLAKITNSCILKIAMNNKAYYSTAEAAKICNVSRGSIVRWIREGRLNASETFGGHHRVSREELIGVLKKLNMPIPDSLKIETSKESSEKILIVDDDESIRCLIKAVIVKHFPTYETEEAESGFWAGYKVHELRPKLVILDINLPEMSGYDICTQVRQNLTKEESVVIAISAEGEEALKDMKNHGADDVLLKPFTTEQLISKLGKYLQQDYPRQIGKAS